MTQASTSTQKPVAVFKTTSGEIRVQLFPEQAPETVKNFIGLATGEKAWKHPRSGEDMTGKPLYNGTIFHRVIPGFMIQGGYPLGTGTGGPGYRFGDEFHPSLKFDRKGLLAMANAGPGTNGSQFFITATATPHLNNHHTIFGEVTSGYDVVEKIIKQPRDGRDRPSTPISIESITIEG
jgi:peptidyl-prolyl cis-trans isomerase A (cyclophilin A)